MPLSHEFISKDDLYMCAHNVGKQSYVKHVAAALLKKSAHENVRRKWLDMHVKEVVGHTLTQPIASPKFHRNANNCLYRCMRWVKPACTYYFKPSSVLAPFAQSKFCLCTCWSKLWY